MYLCLTNSFTIVYDFFIIWHNRLNIQVRRDTYTHRQHKRIHSTAAKNIMDKILNINEQIVDGGVTDAARFIFKILQQHLSCISSTPRKMA